MVYLVEVKPGLWYAYKSVRLPGHKHPVKQYIGPASKTMIKAEAAERKKRSPTPDKSSSGEKLDYKGER